jgi:Type IV secretion-system coupling protein DNA-binding domain
MSSSACRYLLPGLVAVSTPSPTPSPIDSTTLGEQQLAYFEGLGASIKLAVQHAVVFALHALLVAAELALAVGIIVLAVRLGRPWLRHAMNRRPMAGIRILPPTDSAFQSEAWVACFRALYAIARPWWKSWLVGQPSVVFEYRTSAGRASVHCWFPADVAHSVSNALAVAVPGVELRAEDETELLRLPAARARLRLWREPLYPLGTPRVDALASAVAALAESDDALLQISVAPDTGWERRASRRLAQLSGDRPAVPLAVRILLKLVSLPFDLFFEIFWSSSSTTSNQPRPQPRPQPLRPRLPEGKAYEACWRADIRICSWADRPSIARENLRPVAAAFQALDGENRLRQKRVWWRPGFDDSLRNRLGPSAANLVLSASELAQLCHLPLAGVAMDSAHVQVAPRHALGGAGSVLARLEDQKQTAVQIVQADRRQHLWTVGPTGSGKSTLLLNLALQDIDAGIGVGVVDPKGDLIRDLLERIPSAHKDRLVFFDPAQRDRPLGLNVLDCDKEHERELVTDSVVSIFRKTYERFWGPRTDDILRAAVLTLLRHPGTTLCDVPILLLDRGVRSRLTKHLDDPIGLRPFWQEYEAFAEGQRAQMVGPVLNKLRSFLLRPTVCNVLGQSRSTVDFAEIMDLGGILLVNLSKGALGEESSRLLGSFIVSRLWQAALRRATRPESWRPDFNLYLDEFQNYLHLPQSLDDVLTESRAYRLNLTLANQHLGQLRDITRQAVEANTRTKVVFQLSQEDARHLAREFSPLTDSHLQTLGLHQVAVSLCVHGHTEAAFTAVTQPAPPSLGAGHAAELAAESLRRHGRPRIEVEAEIQGRLASLGFRGDFKEIA